MRAILPKLVHKCTRDLPEFTHDSGYNSAPEYFTIHVYMNLFADSESCRQFRPVRGVWAGG